MYNIDYSYIKGRKVNFREGNFQRPSDNISVNDKLKPDYHLAWQTFIYDNYIGGYSKFTPATFEIFERNRKYGEGNQDVTRYIEMYDPTFVLKDSPSAERRVGYSNINFDVIPIIPEFRDIFTGILMATEHDIIIRGIDPYTSLEREEDLEYRFAITELQDLYSSYGINIEKPEGYIPSSREEIEYFLKLGLHKLRFEIGLEKIVNHVFNKSNWNNDIKERLLHDLFDLNVMCVEDYVDTENQRCMCRYLDPAKVIVPRFTGVIGDSIDYAAYQFDMTIADFRAENPDIPEETVRSIAMMFAGKFGNHSGRLTSSSSFEMNGKSNYDDFVIPCMRAYYKTVNREVETKKVLLSAKKIKVKEDELKSGKVKYENGKYYKDVTNTYVYKTIYGSKWVIGTDIVWDYGVINDVPRYSDDVVIPIHVVCLKGKSFNERMQPNADNMQIAWYKFQNAWSNAAPKGLAVDELSITTSAGGAGLKPKEIMRIRKVQGDLVINFAPLSAHTGTRRVNNMPIMELEGGIGRTLDEFLRTWMWNLSSIQKTIGINEVADASNPNPNITKGQADIAMLATNNALKSRYIRYLSIKEKVCKNILTRVLRIVYDNDDKNIGYYTVIGEPYVVAIKEAYKRGLTPEDLGITIKARPTEKDIMELEAHLNNALVSGRNGKPTITMSDYFMIKNMISEPNGLLMAQHILGIIEEKRNAEDIKNAMAVQTQMAEEARKTEEMKRKLEMEAKAIEHKMELEKIKLKADLELRNLEAMYQLKERLQTHQSDLDIGNKYLEKKFENGYLGEEEDESQMGLAGEGMYPQQFAGGFGGMGIGGGEEGGIGEEGQGMGEEGQYGVPQGYPEFGGGEGEGEFMGEEGEGEGVEGEGGEEEEE